MVTVFDLPQDNGAVPAGMWLLVLADSISDSFGGLTLKDGVSQFPVTGSILQRVCTSMRVVGALRVEGELCELGDVSALKPKPAESLRDSDALSAQLDDIGTADTEPPKKARK